MGVVRSLGRVLLRCAALPVAVSGHGPTGGPLVGTRTHPLHTTITMVTYDRRSQAATATMRIFVSDLAAAIARRANAVHATASAQPSDSNSFAYVAGVFTVIGQGGQPAVLQSCGSRVTGDLMWLCVRVAVPGGLAGVRLGNAALQELFDDQVNVVMIDHDGHRDSLLFTKGDGPKPVS